MTSPELPVARAAAVPRAPAGPGAGPRVVAIGGGRGLAVTVRAALRYAGHLAAVVATADDSGSSGRLRRDLAVPALGDLRRCLVAMAGLDGHALGRALEHRFPGTDVAGHALGNLLLAGLTAVTGDLLAATREMSRLLGIHPETRRVLPATTCPVELQAWTGHGRKVFGQYAISQTAGIERVRLQPSDARAADGASELVLHADQVVLGPGSLYTSVLAAALVEELHRALATTLATVVYVCNLEPERYETDGLDATAHVAALLAHGVRPHVVVVPAGTPPGTVGAEVVVADVAGASPVTHDDRKLAAALATLVPEPSRRYLPWPSSR